MTFFFDTSALVKIYHIEEGTSGVLEIYNGRQAVWISELGRVEFISAIHKKFREGQIDEVTLEKILLKFEFDLDVRFSVLIFSSIVIEESQNLLRNHARYWPLRTLDSMQLAFFNSYCSHDVQFVCADARLCQVAETEGFSVFNPVL